MIHPVVINPVINPVVRIADIVGWRAGKVPFPSGAILHFDANSDPYTEQTGGPHAFNYAILSPQYQIQADGLYVNVGAKVAADFCCGERWVRSCGAITNLFAGDSSIARAVSLTNGTVYTLQVFGAGTVSCSYGEATVAAPLKITANSTASVTFTPTGATYWMLTATSYPVPYVPPGVTQPASNATATNGMWFANPDASPLWELVDGAQDGVELVTNGSMSGTYVSGVAPGWEKNAAVAASESNQAQRIVGLSITDNNGIRTIFANEFDVVSGQRYLLSFDLTVNSGALSKVALVKSDGSAEVVASAISTSGNKRIVMTPTWTGKSYLTIGSGWYQDFDVIFDNISIQRIQPQPLTVGIRARLNFASTDLPNSSTLNIATPDDVAGRFLTIQKDAAGVLTAVLSDGTNSATVPLSAWARGAVLHFYPQVKTGATQMRIGYKTAAATSITWGTAATYAGTFGPDATLDRLMIGFNNAYPFGTSKLAVVPGEIADAEILGWWV